MIIPNYDQYLKYIQIGFLYFSHRQKREAKREWSWRSSTMTKTMPQEFVMDTVGTT